MRLERINAENQRRIRIPYLNQRTSGGKSPALANAFAMNWND